MPHFEYIMRGFKLDFLLAVKLLNSDSSLNYKQSPIRHSVKSILRNHKSIREGIVVLHLFVKTPSNSSLTAPTWGTKLSDYHEHIQTPPTHKHTSSKVSSILKLTHLPALSPLLENNNAQTASTPEGPSLSLPRCQRASYGTPALWRWRRRRRRNVNQRVDLNFNSILLLKPKPSPIDIAIVVSLFPETIGKLFYTLHN